MDAEQIEKVRQAIMRFRELLDQLKANGERAYDSFFQRTTRRSTC